MSKETLEQASKIIENKTIRELRHLTQGMPASDGAGVKLTRLIGTPELNMLDPFLMLDAFESDNADDYIAGFPPHPHRGFETVTYMLAGRMRHKDSAGNEGVIAPNGVQWMTAGRGIIHSEMPEQEAGLMQGFQLWVNLPAKEKLTEPQYQEFPADQIAVETTESGGEIRVIAGQTNAGTQGAVVNEFVKPTYLDISLKQGESFSQSISSQENSFIYVISGTLAVGEKQRLVTEKQLGILAEGNTIALSADVDTRFILVSATPLNEPVAKGGPFVMNTQDELRQAVDDYHNGKFA